MKKMFTSFLVRAVMLIATGLIAISAQADTEPNNSIAEANLLDLDTDVAGTLAIDDGDFSDYYQLELPANGNVTITADYEEGLSGFIYLYNSSGAQLGFASSATGILTINCVHSGTVYARATRGSGNGTYTLSVSLDQPVNANDAEPNNSLAEIQATYVENQEFSGQVGYFNNPSSDTEDWYYLLSPRDGNVTLTATYDEGLSGFIYLYEKDGTQISFVSVSSGTASVTAFCYAEDTLVARLTRGSGCGSYTASFETSTLQNANDLEPNNFSTEIQETYEEGEEFTGHLGYVDADFGTDQNDWFAIVSPRDGNVTLTATYDEPLNGFIYLYEKDGTQIGFSAVNGTTGSYTALCYASDTLFARISRGSGCGSYTASFETSTLENELDSEPNNLIGEASVFVQEAEEFTGHLGYTDADIGTDSNDWFGLITDQNGDVTLNVTYDEPLSGFIYLYRKGGAQIGFSSIDGGSASFTAFCMAADTLYARISRGSGCGSYTGSFSMSPNLFENDAEPNDVIDDAIVLDPENFNEGHLGYFDDDEGTDSNDYYEIFVESAPFELEMNLVKSTDFGGFLYLYNSSGAQLDFISHSELIEATYEETLDEPGTYYIRVSRTSGCGSYALFGPNLSLPVEADPIACSDGIDNNGDGLIDCEDPQCQTLSNNVGCTTCFEDGLSFADEVIEYENNCSNNSATDPSQALGVPNYTGASEFITLGAGFIKLGFTNNTLINSGNEDPDLFVFEVGPAVEGSAIELRPLNSSTEDILIANSILDSDGDGFYEFGTIGGSTASVDIDSFFDGLETNSVQFDAIKIFDFQGGCGGSTPGPDIDAVCALSSLPCAIGAPCDDGDEMTENDVFDANCNCEGELVQIEGCGLSNACNFNPDADIINNELCIVPEGPCEFCVDEETIGSSVVAGGTLTYADGSESQTQCAGEDVNYDVSLSGNEGAASIYVVTASIDDDLTILGLQAEGPFNFAGAPADTCLVWHLSYDPDRSNVDTLETGDSALDLDGCFELSNSIEIIREDCPTCTPASSLLANIISNSCQNGDGNYTVSVSVSNDGTASEYIVSNNLNDETANLLVNESIELTFPSGSEVNLTANAVGFDNCSVETNISFTCPDPVPDNDLCVNAEPLICGQTISGSNIGASDQGNPGECTVGNGFTPGPAGVWYSFMGDGSTVTASTCNAGTNFDTKLHVYSGTCGDLSCVGSNDDAIDDECLLDGLFKKTTVEFESQNDVHYFILVTGFDADDTGNFELTLTCSNTCDADAGSLTIDQSPVELVDDIVTLSATPNGDNTVPDGYSTVYVLTSGEGLIIRQTSVTPSFDVMMTGVYTLHTLVYNDDPESDDFLDLSDIVLDETTGFDILNRIGESCADLDVAGASVVVNPCTDEDQDEICDAVDDCVGEFDALGVCNGDCEADADEDGICDDVDDCVGEFDAIGVCNGNCQADEDDDGICDDVDDCVGEFDAIGVCNGDCQADEDDDGICDDVDDCVGEFDAIGVCNGDCESDLDGDGICDDLVSDCEDYEYYLADILEDGTTNIYEVELSGTDAALTLKGTSEYEVHIALNEANGLIYAVSKADGSYRTFDPETGDFGPVEMLDTEVSEIVGATFNADGKLLILSQSENAIYSVMPSTNEVDVFDSYSPSLGGDIDFGSDGALYLATREGGGTFYLAIPDEIASDILKGDAPNLVTGIADTEAENLIFSHRDATTLMVREYDGTPGTPYDITLAGEPFMTFNGDLASGCADNRQDLEECEQVIYYTNQPPGGGDYTLYSVILNGDGSSTSTELLSGLGSSHIGVTPDGSAIYIVGGSDLITYDTESASIVNTVNIVSESGANLSGFPACVVTEDGTLYIGGNGDNVYSVDPATGIATLITSAYDVNGGDLIEAPTGENGEGELWLITRGNDTFTRLSDGASFTVPVPEINGAAVLENGNVLLANGDGDSEDAFIEVSLADASIVASYDAEYDVNNGDLAATCVDPNPDTSNPCLAEGVCNAESAVYVEGTTQNGGSLSPARAISDNALGAPEGTDAMVFTSLGYGGSLTFEFDGVVPNAEGDDIQVVETSFGNPGCEAYPEYADVSVSADGEDFFYIGTVCKSDNAVDISDAEVSLDCVSYVRVANNDGLTSTPDGFDVDGIIAIHNCAADGEGDEGEEAGIVANENSNNTLSSYPNPTNGPSVAVFVTGNTERASLEVYDMNGRLVEGLFSGIAESGVEYRIDFDGLALPNGVYMYRLTTDSETIVEKFMIAK